MKHAETPGDTQTACPRCWRDKNRIVRLAAEEGTEDPQYYRFPGEAVEQFSVRMRLQTAWFCEGCKSRYRERVIVEVDISKEGEKENWGAFYYPGDG